MRTEDILQISPVIPVLTIEDAAIAVPLASALVRGGVRVLEVTLRTPAALDAIRVIREKVADAVVGAGTVLNVRDLQASRDAGATFIVSPGATPQLLKAAADQQCPFLPGIATASDIMVGLDHGYSCFKFFPAENLGGIATLKALSAPFSQVRFCPTGGITLESARNYFALSTVVCVGGSWLAPSALIARKDWNAIEEIATRTLQTLLNAKP